MNAATFAVKNALRSKRRTLLTILSLGVSIFAIAMLATFLEAFDNGLAETEALGRLIVKRRTSIAEEIPESYKERIEGIEVGGRRVVEYAHGTSWFGGKVEKADVPPERAFFAQFAEDLPTFRAYFEPMIEWTSENFYERFAAEKTALVVGKAVADKFKWQIGDRVTILGQIYPVNLEFVVVGTFKCKTGFDDNMVNFRRDRLEEARAAAGEGKLPGKVGVYVVKPAPGLGPEVARKVDAMFLNSPAETETVTEREFQASFTEMLGNIRQFITVIGGIVAISILLVAANTMAMSARERSNESAVMRTLGFERWHVVALFIAEGVAVTLAGCALGIGAVEVFTRRSEFRFGFFASFALSPRTALGCVALALGIGLVAAGIPAVLTARRPIAEALRKVV